MHTRNKAHLFLRLVALALLVAALVPGAASAAKPTPPPATVYLTSVTIDPEDATGTTTNAPGAWSTNLADPLSQVGLKWRGDWLNIPEETFELGEISIPLRAGTNVFHLYGTGIFPENLYYGAVLFFDGRQVGPQIAVYNANGGTGHFMVQPRIPGEWPTDQCPPPELCSIMGGANGGCFFDRAPGTSVYTAPDGTTVEVQSFTVDALTGAQDVISHYTIGPDGTPDMTATLVLKVTPPTTR